MMTNFQDHPKIKIIAAITTSKAKPKTKLDLNVKARSHISAQISAKH